MPVGDVISIFAEIGKAQSCNGLPVKRGESGEKKKAHRF